MGLSPEEKKRIYEEEKARIEAAEKTKKGKGLQKVKGSSTTSLRPGVAGLLCYLGFWVTGIIFLVIEKKNKLIRFHAMQSLVALGILHIIWGIALNIHGWGFGFWGWGMGGFFNPVYVAAFVIFIIFFVLWWVLWAVGMYRAYHERPFRIALFSNLAEKCLAKLDGGK